VVLKLLLDEHLSPEIGVQVRRHNPAIAITSVRDWMGGIHLGKEDAALLEVAYREGLTLITYDQRTIPSLLTLWGEQRLSHGGVLLADERRIPPYNIGRLVKAIIEAWEEYGQEDWTNRMFYLK
jgi:Domain of unknown function (DUF5615)